MVNKLNKKNFIVICIAFLIGIFISLAFTFLVNIIFPQPGFYFGKERFIAIALTVGSTLCLIYHRAYFAKNLHKAFLLIALAFGISLALVFPKTLYIAPDDQIHFRNIYFFTESSTELKGGFLAIESSDFTNINPKERGFDELSAVYEEMNASNTLTIDDKTNVDQVMPLYQRIVYLPFYIGLKLSDFLHLSFTTGIIIAKICNLACYVALIYIAIRESGKFRKIFFLVGLLVSNIFLATQFSYDPIIIASLLLAISLFLHMRQSDTVDNKHLLGFVLAVTLGSLAKAIYCPLMLLILLIPHDKFDSKRRATAFKACAMLVMITLASTYVLPVLSGSMAGDVRGGNTSVSGQLQFLLSNPLAGIAAVVKFALGQLPDHLVSAAALVSLGISADPGTIYDLCAMVIPAAWAISLITLLWATFSTDGQAILVKHLKIAIAAISAILVGMIFASMYLGFTSVGSTEVAGIQPRYFIPLLPLLLILLVPTKPKLCEEKEIERREENSASSAILLFAPCLTLLLVFGIYVLRMSML